MRISPKCFSSIDSACSVPWISLWSSTIISRTCFELVRSLVFVTFSKGGGLDVFLPQSRSICLSTVARLTDAEFCVYCLSLQTRPITVTPNWYCSSQSSSSFPKMMFIGWKAAGTLHPMSRPVSTTERCCLLSAIWDRCFHWLALRYVCNILMWSGVVFSWVCKRDFGWCIFIFLESWIDGSITFLVLIEFVPTTVLTCRSTSGVSTSSYSSKGSARVWARIWSLGDNFPSISRMAIMYLSFLSIWSQS